MSTGKKISYILAVVMLFLFGGIGILLAGEESSSEQVDSYQSCVQAGGAILESYPEQCMSPDGSASYPNPAQAIDLPAMSQ